MNGVVKTDESDSVVGEITESTAAPESGQDSAEVIQPSGVGPAIHLNGSTGQDQPVQVCLSVHPTAICLIRLPICPTVWIL